MKNFENIKNFSIFDISNFENFENFENIENTENIIFDFRDLETRKFRKYRKFSIFSIFETSKISKIFRYFRRIFVENRSKTKIFTRKRKWIFSKIWKPYYIVLETVPLCTKFNNCVQLPLWGALYSHIVEIGKCHTIVRLKIVIIRVFLSIL